MRALDVQQLSVTAPGGAVVLDDVSLTVTPGECLAVVGQSGAGKSVLARTLLGLPQGQRGWRVQGERLGIAGLELIGASQREWRQLRGRHVALVLQDALQSLDPLRTIEAEVGEALAIRGVPRAERRRRAIEAMTEAGLADASGLLRQRSGQLSGGMRQRALIASAVIGGPELIVADEPTTALDPVTAERVLALFRQLRDEGSALLFISHDLRAVERVADRVAVLDGGRVIETGTIDRGGAAPDAAIELPPGSLRSLRHPVSRRLVEAIPTGPKPTPAPERGRSAPPLVEVRSAARRFGGGAGLHGVSLAVDRGESVGIVGRSGAGKTTLARLIAGADRPDSGEIRIHPGASVRLIPQDPLSTFDPRWRVERIVAASLARGSALTPTEMLDAVGLDASLLSRRPATLSGGQRQRVAIARALAAEPDVLVCDEPVSALDMPAQAGVLALLRELQERRSLAIVLVSHDLAAVRTVCDRAVVLHEGRIAADGPAELVLA